MFFPPWFPEAAKNPEIAKKFMDEWNERGHNVGGLTEGFRGWDGIFTHRRGHQGRRQGRAPRRSQKALWNVKVKGINGDIAFIKQGPAGKESAPERAERLPGQDRGRQGHQTEVLRHCAVGVRMT